MPALGPDGWEKSVAILAYWYFLERRDVGFARVCFQALRYFQAFILLFSGCVQN